MKVNKQLIEKYHLNLCSKEEQALVEDWLFSEESDDILLLSQPEQEKQKQEIWAGIVSTIPVLEEPVTKTIKLKNYFSPQAKRAIAASLIFGILTGLGTWWMHINTWNKQVSVNNSRESQNEQVQTSGLNIILGPQSRANISSSEFHQSGKIDFCGTIMINPKEDFELTLKANCADPTRGTEKIKLKKGQNYIAVNYRFNSTNELIIVNEDNLINLPPHLQRELIEKFNI